MKKLILFFILSLLIIGPTIAQQKRYSLGLIMNKKTYDAMPRKTRLTEKAYQAIPPSASLKSYCPEIGDQGANGTCVGWSTAWAMRTIIEAKAKQISGTGEITRTAFSPAFNYYFSTDQDNFSCERGADISEALNSMVQRGVPLYSDFPESCQTSVPDNILTKAQPYRLKDATRLFDDDATSDIKISAVKTALNNGNPVTIGMRLPESFFSAMGCWSPSSGEPMAGGHAMCVVGYDDNKYGGAFEIMNSWGRTWGNNGFIWVRYNDFATYTKYAFEAYPEKTTPQGTTISGTIRLVSNSGSELPVGKNKDLSVKGQTVVDDVAIGDYVVGQPLPSGSRYRLYVTASQSVYLYVISSDLTNNVSQLFPVRSESALLSYSTNEIALPSEKAWIQLDNTTGKDFTVVIYSSQELNIVDIIRNVISASGSIVEKVNAALGDDLIQRSSMTMNPDKISFEAKAGSQTAAAIIIEINHQ